MANLTSTYHVVGIFPTAKPISSHPDGDNTNKVVRDRNDLQALAAAGGLPPAANAKPDWHFPPIPAQYSLDPIQNDKSVYLNSPIHYIQELRPSADYKLGAQAMDLKLTADPDPQVVVANIMDYCNTDMIWNKATAIWLVRQDIVQTEKGGTPIN